MSTPEGFPYNRAVPGVDGLKPYQPGKPIEELERELGVANAIKLASNENPLGPSPLAMAAIRESVEGVSLYPDANGFVLKRALGERLGVAPERITLGNGSNDVLDLIARTFVAPGDEVMFSQYAFLVYPLVTQAAGGRCSIVPARNWGHDLEAMAAATSDRTKVVFLANPNNPTGTYVPREELEHFLVAVPSNTVVVLDEAYFEYVDRADYPNGIELLARYDNLVVTRTFSKAYGLAGLRVGYAVASPAITDLLNRVRQPFNVSSVAQAAALAALDDPEHVARSRDLNRQQMVVLSERLADMGFPHIPSVANFLTVEFGERAGHVYEALLSRGVIVRPIANYGMPNHLRVSIGRPRENDQFLAALPEILGR